MALSVIVRIRPKSSSARKAPVYLTRLVALLTNIFNSLSKIHIFSDTKVASRYQTLANSPVPRASSPRCVRPSTSSMPTAPASSSTQISPLAPPGSLLTQNQSVTFCLILLPIHQNLSQILTPLPTRKTHSQTPRNLRNKNSEGTPASPSF